MRVFVFLSLEVEQWLELLMGLLLTKTYLCHWVYIFAQFWTRFYCSTTIKCFLSANEFKTESNLCSYMSKQGNSFPLGRVVLCVTKEARWNENAHLLHLFFSFSSMKAWVPPSFTQSTADLTSCLLTFCLTNTRNCTRIVILNLVYWCQIAWK